jgi:glucose-6-phosphate isomerase
MPTEKKSLSEICFSVLLKWRKNSAYIGGEFIEKKARPWEDFGLEAGVPIYTQFQEDKDRFMFVADPKRYQNMWKGFEP